MCAEKPFLNKTEDGFQLRYNGRNLYAAGQPKKSAENRARRIPLAPSTLIIVPSPLLGYGLDVLLERLSDNSYVFAVEIERSLYDFSLSYISSYLQNHEDIGFYKFNTIDEIIHSVLKIGIHRFRKCILLPLSGGYSLNASEYRVIAKALENEINLYWQNNLTLIKMGRLWIKNIIRNLKYIPGSSSPEEIQIEKPVVIAGAGESLERGIEIIRKYRDRFLLVCADTAAASIEAAGMFPDLIISLESQYANLKDFVPLGISHHSLLADITSYPPVMRRADPAHRHLFSSHFRKNALLDRLESKGLLPPVLEPLGSVGVAAYVLISSMTRSLVFVTGLDFSYVTGKPHARGCPSHIEYLTRLNRTAFPALFAACLARPRVSKGSARGGSVQSDLVLMSYAEQLRPYLKKHTNTFQIGGGIDLSLPLIECEKEFESALDTVIAEENPSVEADTGKLSCHKNNNQLIEFMRNEITLLDTTLEMIHDFINSTPDAQDKNLSTKDKGIRKKDDLILFLQKTDYIYIDFPDPPPLPKKSISFLRRCIGAGRYYRSLFNQALDEICGQY